MAVAASHAQNPIYFDSCPQALAPVEMLTRCQDLSLVVRCWCMAPTGCENVLLDLGVSDEVHEPSTTVPKEYSVRVDAALFGCLIGTALLLLASGPSCPTLSSCCLVWTLPYTGNGRRAYNILCTDSGDYMVSPQKQGAPLRSSVHNNKHKHEHMWCSFTTQHFD